MGVLTIRTTYSLALAPVPRATFDGTITALTDAGATGLTADNLRFNLMQLAYAPLLPHARSRAWLALVNGLTCGRNAWKESDLYECRFCSPTQDGATPRNNRIHALWTCPRLAEARRALSAWAVGPAGELTAGHVLGLQTPPNWPPTLWLIVASAWAMAAWGTMVLYHTTLRRLPHARPPGTGEVLTRVRRAIATTVRGAFFSQRQAVVQEIQQAGQWFSMDRVPAPGVGRPLPFPIGLRVRAPP